MSTSPVVTFDDRKLQRLFKELPDRIERKVLRQSTNKAATPILKGTKQRCPTGDSGQLKASLIKKIKTYTSTNTVVAIIGSSRATFAVVNGKTYRPSNYIHLVEDGAKAHTIKIKYFNSYVTIQHPGFAGRHFMEKAFNATKGTAQSIANTSMAQGLIREGQKLGL